MPEYRLGFKDLHDANPEAVGDPLEDEFSYQGRSFQETENGLLYWIDGKPSLFARWEDMLTTLGPYEPPEQAPEQAPEFRDVRDKCHRAGYPMRAYEQITHFVVHYSGVDVDSSAESIDAYHRGPPNSWPGSGYTFCIRWNGTVEQAHPLETVSYHCGTGSDSVIMGVGSNNWKAASVCLPGLYPTPEQLASLRWLFRKVQRDLGKALIATPHSAISKGGTVCPGVGWRDWWPF